jgi:hypothetical protein
MMEVMTNDIRTAEYESLRQEVLQNKRFVFERPLAIIAAAGLAALQLSASPSMLALPPLVILVLCVNLWFTANRIWSNARIVGYIAVALEPGSGYTWMGWENALRLHRKWTKTHSPEQRQKRIKPHLAFDTMPDSMMFYPMLLGLHVVPVVFAFTALLLTITWNHPIAESVMLVATILSASCFVALCLGPHRPHKMTHLIEEQRATWLAVFAESKANKASEIRAGELVES